MPAWASGKQRAKNGSRKCSKASFQGLSSSASWRGGAGIAALYRRGKRHSRARFVVGAGPSGGQSGVDVEDNKMKNAERSQTRQLSSDTFAGICPEALQAIVEANHGHAAPYGDDPWTARATQVLRELFETDCAVFFVGTGTAANALGLAAVCQSYHSVLCHADAHIHTDECGAPEYAGGGVKLVPIAGEHGKLTPAAIKEAAARRRDVHSSKPRVVSISQATEVGTVYTAAEIRDIGDTAHDLGLKVHVDGARLANALATLDAPQR